MATFDQLVKQIDGNLDKQRDRGTAFEKMVVAYLKNEPAYKQKFPDVWMLNGTTPCQVDTYKNENTIFLIRPNRGNIPPRFGHFF